MSKPLHDPHIHPFPFVPRPQKADPVAQNVAPAPKKSRKGYILKTILLIFLLVWAEDRGITAIIAVIALFGIFELWKIRDMLESKRG